MIKSLLLSSAFFSLLTLSQHASAYVGPGAGISLIGALVGLVAAIATALWVLFSHPIKKALKKNKSTDEEENTEDPNNTQQAVD